MEGAGRDFMLLTYQDDAKLYVPLERLDLVEKYRVTGDGAKPALDRLGGVSWARTKSRAAVMRPPAIMASIAGMVSAEAMSSTIMTSINSSRVNPPRWATRNLDSDLFKVAHDPAIRGLAKNVGDHNSYRRNLRVTRAGRVILERVSPGIFEVVDQFYVRPLAIRVLLKQHIQAGRKLAVVS